jgi:hypothetical protein
MEIRVNIVLAAIAARATVWVILGLAVLVFAAPVAAQDAWPAEPIGASTNLTAIEGPGENDFQFGSQRRGLELSDAHALACAQRPQRRFQALGRRRRWHREL